METKERMISIRLLEKIKKNPEYQKMIQIDAKSSGEEKEKKTKD